MKISSMLEEALLKTTRKLPSGRQFFKLLILRKIAHFKWCVIFYIKKDHVKSAGINLQCYELICYELICYLRW